MALRATRKQLTPPIDLSYAQREMMQATQRVVEPLLEGFKFAASFLVRDTLATYQGYCKQDRNPLPLFAYMQDEGNFIQLMSIVHRTDVALRQRLNVSFFAPPAPYENLPLGRLAAEVEHQLNTFCHSRDLLTGTEVLHAFLLVTDPNDPIAKIGFTAEFDSKRAAETLVGRATSVPSVG